MTRYELRRWSRAKTENIIIQRTWLGGSRGGAKIAEPDLTAVDDDDDRSRANTSYRLGTVVGRVDGYKKKKNHRHLYTYVYTVYVMHYNSVGRTARLTPKRFGARFGPWWSWFLFIYFFSPPVHKSHCKIHIRVWSRQTIAHTLRLTPLSSVRGSSISRVTRAGVVRSRLYTDSSSS